MAKFDVIVIGAGLGGLECGYILAKQGYSVCVLEKNDIIGGCIQSYTRCGHTLDTGFHYVGGLGEGEVLHKLFDYFGLLSLPWHRLDSDNFDEVIISGKSYPFANGYGRFAEKLSESFPSQKENLRRYSEFLNQVGDSIMDGLHRQNAEQLNNSLFARSAWDFLEETISDPLLRQVLSGTSLKLELNRDKLPLYIFAQINSSFIQSAWRLEGGGSLVAQSLADSITRMGGSVRTRAQVSTLRECGGSISEVVLSTGETLSSKYVISNIHPAATMSLIPSETKAVRRIYRERISSLPNTQGMFTASVILKKDRLPYLNRNLYISECADLWEKSAQGVIDRAMISYKVPSDGGKYAESIDVITPISWEEVSAWKDTSVGHRGEGYLALKRQKAEALLRFVGKYIPLREEDIEKVFTSTPLTYMDYTATPYGSAYGIEKDYNNLMFTLLTPKTPLQNLLLTGQNLNLHGILGVSMTSFITCKEITNDFGGFI